jgi:hypothetical protein
MAKLGINTGIVPDDGLGDSLLDGAVKINDNFDEIYTYFGDGTNLTFTGGSSSQWVTTSAGIHTLSNVGIGTTNPTENLTVFGDARVTGILTVGTASITLDGSSNTITVGSGVTIDGSTGIIEATSLIIEGTTFTGAAVTSITAGSGISVDQSTGNVTITATGGGITTGIATDSERLDGELPSYYLDYDNFTNTPTIPTNLSDFSNDVGFITSFTDTNYWIETSAGIHTLSNVGIGTTNPIEKLTVVGVTSSTAFYGDASYTTSGRWTLGANGTSDYTFTGIGFTQTTNDPVLYLARGRVYEFVNNSGGSHPFQIRVSDGGASYNDGVTNNGAASGVIRFEIPFNAPNTLYYQCTNHSGMGNTISVYPSTI